MAIACLGLSHRTAPVEVREHHVFTGTRTTEALVALRDYEAVREAAMLSTCNRLEIYAELDDAEAGLEQLREFLINFRHSALAYDIRPYLYALEGEEAVAHFMRVATGVDSMLIGEAEVLAQVKDAYLRAHRAGSIGKTLHRLFRHALSAGKAARSQTAIGSASVSIATAAIELAKTHLGALQGKRIVVVGAGKMGTTAAKRLKLEGAEIVIANRTHERAWDLVRSLGVGGVAELPSLVEALTSADIAITSTGASHFVLTPDNVAEAMRRRADRPLFIVDIAVPRDVDPDVAAIPGVRLTDIDQLGAAVAVTLDRRREAVPAVEEIVNEHAAQFSEWYAMRPMEPVISSLSQRAELIRQTEVTRLFARCPELDERERLLVTGVSMTIISKLLHTAFAKIHDETLHDEAEATRHARALDELFELGINPPDATSDVDYAPPF